MKFAREGKNTGEWKQREEYGVVVCKEKCYIKLCPKIFREE